MSMLDEMRAIALRHCPTTAWLHTGIASLALIRAESETMPVAVTYKPMLCIALQGAKQVAWGNELLNYGEGSSLVVSVDMPVTGHIIEASAAKPYLAVVLELDPASVAEVHVEMGGRETDQELAMTSADADPEIVDAMLRLMRLLDKPAEAAVLAPLVTREILFRVLHGEQGGMLRALALREGRAGQVAQAIGWIRSNYTQPLRIEALAKHVGMSPTSFHRHFKALTRMSPLQYQKQIRLQEARHLLLAGELDVGGVSAHVGYESATQFTREYSRMFGAPPRRDAERLRSA